MVPEQRVLRIARIGPEQVASVQRDRQGNRRLLQCQPGDLCAEGNAGHHARRSCPTRQPPTRSPVAIRGGQTFAAAAAPAGFAAAGYRGRAADQGAVRWYDRRRKSPTPHSRPPPAALVGPIQSRIGWHVVKIDGIQREGGKSLAAGARRKSPPSSPPTSASKRSRLSSTRSRMRSTKAPASRRPRQQAKLTSTETPLITANGIVARDPAFAAGRNLRPALKAGFELAENDAPVVDSLAERWRLCAWSRRRGSSRRRRPRLPASATGSRRTGSNEPGSQRAKQLATGHRDQGGARLPLAEAVEGSRVPLPGRSR